MKLKLPHNLIIIFNLAIFSIIISSITSCKENSLNKQPSETEISYFNYNGKDTKIRHVVDEVKKLNADIHFVDLYANQGNLDWNHAIITHPFATSDSTNIFIVPFIQKDGQTKSYIRIVSSGGNVKIPELHLYEAQFVKTNNTLLKYNTANLLNNFSKMGLKIPNEVSTYLAEWNNKLEKKATHSITNSFNDEPICSAFIGGEMHYNVRCGPSEVSAELIDYFVNFFDRRLSGVDQVTRIYFENGRGIVIEGKTSYIQSNQAEFLNIMRAAAMNMNVNCISQGSFFFSVLELSTSCTSSGGAPTTPSNPSEIRTDSLTKKFPCVTSKVLNGLMSDVEFGNMLLPFITASFKPELNWDAQPLTWGTDGVGTFMLGSTDQRGSTLGFSSNITLNSHAINNSSELLIAATIIHETQHAYINYYFASNGMPDLMEKSTPSYLAGIYQYSLLVNGTDNLASHYQMITLQYDRMVGILYKYGNGNYTIDDCRMAILYGLNNPGENATAAETAELNSAFDVIMNNNRITNQMLTTFNIANLNTSPANRVPTTGCQ